MEINTAWSAQGSQRGVSTRGFYTVDQPEIELIAELILNDMLMICWRVVYSFIPLDIHLEEKIWLYAGPFFSRGCS